MQHRKVTDRVRDTTTHTPVRLATKIIKEDPFSWVVACEGGCGAKIHVPKKEYAPVNSLDPQGQVDVRVWTAAGARSCAACGPL